MGMNLTIKKSIVTFALALSALCLFQAKAEKASAAEPMIVNNEAVVYLDNTDQIAVQGEGIRSVSYSSSKKKVATINQKGKITPRKKGTTTIRAKITYVSEGRNYSRTLSYRLKILGKSGEYFKFSEHEKILYYESDPAIITGLTKAGQKMKTLYLPERHNGELVTDVYSHAFENASAMEKIYISDSVTYLDYGMEDGGDGLWNPGCFDDGCEHLKEIHLGKNVKTFGKNANLPNLERITVAPGNKTFRVEDGVLLGKRVWEGANATIDALICYPAKKKDISYTIPKGIAYTAGSAFAWAESLEHVNFTEGIRQIGMQAFSHTGLREAVLPEGIQDIDYAFADCIHLEKAVIPQMPDDSRIEYSFMNCRNLKTVILKNLPQHISSAFSGCASLKKLQLPADMKGIVEKEDVLFDSSMETLLFYPAGKKEKKYQIPSGVKKIGEYAFAGIQYLSEVTANKELQVIDDYAFENAKIEKIHLNERLQKINYKAFFRSNILELSLPDHCQITSGMVSYCKRLRNMKLPADIKELCIDCEGCSSLQTLCIPQNLIKITDCDLRGCISLTSIKVEKGNQYFTAAGGILYSKSKKRLIAYPAAKKSVKFTVPKSVTKIDGHAFADSRNLKEVSMTYHVTECGQNAFSNGVALRTVKMGKNLKKIGASAFSNCRNLEKIVIPDKIKRIDSETFDGCTSLRSIILGKNTRIISVGAFKDCRKLQKIRIPDKAKTIGMYAFDGCSSLKSLCLGKGVKKIDMYAFRDCRNLQKITFRKKSWERSITLNQCFVRTGSKNYRKLTMRVPKKWREDRELMTGELRSAGLSKKAKIKYY